MKKYIAIVLLLLSAVISCAQEDGTRYPVKIGTKTYYLEVADSPQERQQGLMYRRSMDDSEGMIFIFENEENRSFWMRNTYIDLSIAYLDSRGRIIEILDMYALDDTPVPGSAPARYAIELCRGAFDRAGAAAGDLIDLTPLPGF